MNILANNICIILFLTGFTVVYTGENPDGFIDGIEKHLAFQHNIEMLVHTVEEKLRWRAPKISASTSDENQTIPPSQPPSSSLVIASNTRLAYSIKRLSCLFGDFSAK
ncbi:hypothetical protein BCV72DRAFT_305782 [Rhizopus microsporus var. microsporus]|uniref:Uncharacterized protein n=2 Tax=Rhizopus microsporus TaxID=58291 RepID=A0A2G4T3H4_RHIZD|nr:uncharacterized protein RHIMIDRAFT_234900 [Rhizopus microsporus ATCC 52813]ORE06115.1 hypothetical protein BCV72DRAFT_305782 [Rhizopus microsporus var. microsporus]PHZ15557.1 hypothetical protein RHIMIDRAFT_234900 [Rhizopus microsporus ATCC 52813]